MARRARTAINDVIEHFKEAEDARRGIEEVMLQNYRLYRNIDPELLERQKDERSALFIPKTFTTVEVATRFIVNSLLAERPYVFGYPRMVEDELAFLRASSMQTLIDYQLAELMQFRTMLTKAVRAMLVYGYVPAQIGWLHKKRNRRRRKRNDKGVVVDVITESRVVQSRPDIRIHDPLGFFWDPFAESLEDAEFVVTQQFVTNRWLENRRDIFNNVNKALSTSLPTDSLPSWFQTKRQIRGWTDSQVKRLNEKLEIWTPNGVTTIWNREIVLRDLNENPFDHGEIPFAVAVDTAFINEFPGVGLVQPMADLQVELNAIRNQRMDNVNFLLNKVFTVRDDSSLTEEDLRLKPGHLIPVTDHDEIQELKFDDIRASTYNEEQIINSDIQETTGIQPYMMGSSPEFSRERATTVLALQSAGNEGLRLRVFLLEETFLIPIVRQMSDLNQQFMEPEELVRITGPDGLSQLVNINATDVVGDFDFYWAGSTLDNAAEKQFKINFMTQLFGLLNSAPDVQVNRTEFLRQILKLADIRNVNQIIPPPGEMDQVGIDPMMGMDPAMGADPAAMMGVDPVGIVDPSQDLDTVGRSMRIGPTPNELPL